MDNQKLRRRRVILILLVAILALLAYWLFTLFIFPKGKYAYQIIPRDVAIVCAIDIPQIIKEANFVELQNSTAFKGYINQASLENPVFAEVLKNPIGAGVSIDRDYFFVFDKDTSNNNEDFSALIIPLRDSKAFDKLVNSQKSRNRDIVNEGKFSYYELDQLTAIAWDEHNAILGSANSFMSLRDKMERFYLTPPNESVMNDPKFLEVLSDDSDLAIWLSTNAYVNDKAVLQKFGIDKFDPSLIKDNYVIAAVDFSKGMIEGRAGFELKEEFKETFDNFFKTPVETDIYEYLSVNNLSLIFTAHLNIPRIYNNAIKDPVSKQQINDLLEQRGLSVDDLFRMITGEITVATYNEEGKTSLVLGMRIDNMNKLQQLLVKGVESNILSVKGSNIYVLKAPKENSFQDTSLFANDAERGMLILHNQDFIFLTSSKRFLEQFTYGKVPLSERVAKNIIENFNGFFVAGYSNLKNAPSGAQGSLEMEDVQFHLNKRELSFKLNLANKNNYALKEIFSSP